MPRHCSATGCCTRDTPETRNQGISFHRLPKDNPRRTTWLENCQRKDMSGQGLWDPASKYVYFCSKHFEKNCFELVGTRTWLFLINLSKEFFKQDPWLFVFASMPALSSGMAASVTLVLARINSAKLQDPEKPSEDLPSPPASHSPDPGVSEPVTALICEGCFLCSGYHRLKEGAVPTIFEPHAKPRRKVAKYQQKQSCGCSAEETIPLCMDVSCHPVQELPSPGAAPTTVELRSQPNLPGLEPENLATLSDISLEQLPAATGQEEASQSPALPESVGNPSQPVSLSLYMLRLPPPAGAYIQNEHSYQVGSALLWKRRAEAALDALGKAQQQLQASWCREQRLLLRICELQREQRPHSTNAQQRFKDHLQVFELQLLNDIE